MGIHYFLITIFIFQFWNKCFKESKEWHVHYTQLFWNNWIAHCTIFRIASLDSAHIHIMTTCWVAASLATCIRIAFDHTIHWWASVCICALLNGASKAMSVDTFLAFANETKMANCSQTIQQFEWFLMHNTHFNTHTHTERGRERKSIMNCLFYDFP